MARKKFKLSKSLLARLVAIGVLSGLGGFAIYQSQFSEPAEDESAEVAESDEEQDEAEEDSAGDTSIKIPDSVADANGLSKSAMEKAFASTSSDASRSQGSSANGPIHMASHDTDASPANRSSSRSPAGDVPTMPSPSGALGRSPSASLSDSKPAMPGSSSNLRMPSSQPPNVVTQSPGLPPSQPPSASIGDQGDSTPSLPPTNPSGSSSRLNDLSSNSTPSPGSGSNPVNIPRPDGTSNSLRGAPSLVGNRLSDTEDDPAANAVQAAPDRLNVDPGNSSALASQDSGSESSVPAMPDRGFSMGDRGTDRASAPSSPPGRPGTNAPSYGNELGSSADELRRPYEPPSSSRLSDTSSPSVRQTPGVGSSGRTNVGDAGAPRSTTNGVDATGSRGYGSSNSYGGSTPTDSPRTAFPGYGDRGSEPDQSQPSERPIRTYGSSSDPALPGRYSSNTGRDEAPSYADNAPTNPRDERYGSPSSASPVGRNIASMPNQTDAVSSTPGGKDIEGTQAPSLALEKRAPREVQVGRVANFDTVIRNVGRTEATDVIVTDRVPEGTRLENVNPKPISQQGGLLIWNLGTIKPGQEQVITMNLVPERKGEIGSVAQVTFNAQAGVRTVSTQPKLELQVESPERVLIGQNATLRITVKNSGDGAATGVVIEEDVPQGLSHPEGQELQYPVGTLAPGEVRQLALTLRAESAAAVKNRIIVRGDNNLLDEKAADLEIVAPSLKISMTGPSRRYLERTAIHRIKIDNSGTAAATNVEIVAHLPKGLKFQETNNHGTYDPATHAVYWGLESLPPGTSDDSIQLVTLPVDTGEQNIEYRVAADLNLSDANRMPVMVEELAELFFDIDDVADPIEVDSETMYHLRVTNQGSKVATRVRIQVSFPPELQPIEADGPVTHQMERQAIVFAPIEQIAPGEELLFKIQAKARREGDHRVSVQLISDDSSEPVIKQASTNVYRDR